MILNLFTYGFKSCWPRLNMLNNKNNSEKKTESLCFFNWSVHNQIVSICGHTPNDLNHCCFFVNFQVPYLTYMWKSGFSNSDGTFKRKIPQTVVHNKLSEWFWIRFAIYIHFDGKFYCETELDVFFFYSENLNNSSETA